MHLARLRMHTHIDSYIVVICTHMVAVHGGDQSSMMSMLSRL